MDTVMRGCSKPTEGAALMKQSLPSLLVLGVMLMSGRDCLEWCGAQFVL